MKGLLRLLVVIVVSVLGWLGTAAPVAMAASPCTPLGYAYDGQCHTALLTHTIIERGPPAANSCTTAHDADTQRPLGVLARPNGAATATAYDHNDRHVLGQFACRGQAAEEQTGIELADHAASVPSIVAANSEG